MAGAARPFERCCRTLAFSPRLRELSPSRRLPREILTGFLLQALDPEWQEIKRFQEHVAKGASAGLESQLREIRFELVRPQRAMQD